MLLTASLQVTRPQIHIIGMRLVWLSSPFTIRLVWSHTVLCAALNNGTVMATTIFIYNSMCTQTQGGDGSSNNL